MFGEIIEKQDTGRADILGYIKFNVRVKIQQFLFGKNHSWSLVGKNIGRSLLKLGHDVHFVSTDGIDEKYIEEDLKPHIKSEPTGTYDIQISYTAPHNFINYLSSNYGSKNRFGIWAYEFGGFVLPGFAKYHTFVDRILPPSNFCKEVFKTNGFPEGKMQVIPHGIHLSDYENVEPYKLKTKKKYKIGVVLGQPHLRKNIPGVFETYGRAFKKTDDVCLVLKIALSNKSDQQFNADFHKIYDNFKHKFKSEHAEVEVITDFIPNMAELYVACDSIFTMTNGEGFYMPGLECLGARKLNICPKYSGQLDFLTDDNALLIDTEMVRAPRNYLYWSNQPIGEMGRPSVAQAAELLRKSYEEYDQLMNKFMPSIEETRAKYTWDNAVKTILSLCQ